MNQYILSKKDISSNYFHFTEEKNLSSILLKLDLENICPVLSEYLNYKNRK